MPSSQEFRINQSMKPAEPLPAGTIPTKGCLRRKSSPGDFATTKGPEKKVWFDYVQIKEFPMILGDNPSPNDGGAPLTIGWEPQNVEFHEVDELEIHREERRPRKDLKFSAATRMKIAIMGGSSIAQIGRTSVEIARVQKCRAKASQKGYLELLREGFDRRLHPNRSKMTMQFSRVPNEAPQILSNWKANAGRVLATAA